MAEPAAPPSAGAPPLKSTFNKLSHWHHIIMMTSMVLMAITAAVASAGTSVGILDPFIAYAKMLFSGFTGVGDVAQFVPDAAGNLMQDGTLFSGAEISAHAMHGGAAGGHAAAGAHMHGGVAMAGGGHHAAHGALAYSTMDYGASHAGHFNGASAADFSPAELNNINSAADDMGLTPQEYLPSHHHNH